MIVTFSDAASSTTVEAILMSHPTAQIEMPRDSDGCKLIIWIGGGAFRAVRLDSESDGPISDAHLTAASAIHAA